MKQKMGPTPIPQSRHCSMLSFINKKLYKRFCCVLGVERIKSIVTSATMG